MIKTLSDIANMKSNDINKSIIDDSDIINHFKAIGMAGCEYIEDAGIGQDSDFEELLDYLEADMVEQVIYNDKTYILLYEGPTYILVELKDYTNRFDDTLPDETFYDFNKLIELDKETAEKFIKKE